MPFTIHVVNPCQEPESLQAMPLVDQTYTITDTEFEYQIPAFVVTPEFCDIEYSIKADDTEALRSFIFNAN